MAPGEDQQRDLADPTALRATRTPRARFSWRSFVVTVVVLSLVVLWADPAKVLLQLRGVNLAWLLPAFVVGVLQLALLGLRWSYLARRLGLPLTWFRATSEYALSVAVNLVLPSGFAGDGLRAYRHSRSVAGRPLLRVLEALALDRVSGQLALWLVVLATAPLTVTGNVLQVRHLAIGSSLLVAVVALLVFVSRGRGPFSRLQTVLRRAASVLLSPRALLVHIGLSLVFTVLSLAQLYIAARATGATVSPESMLWVGPLILVAASLPSFFAGWGVREGASGVLFAAAGASASTGVAVSVVYGVFGLVVFLPGLLVLLADGAREQQPTGHEAPTDQGNS